MIKDRLMFCPHTKNLVGYSDDAFDIDVIRNECQRRFGATTTANSDSNNETADTNMAEIGDEEVADGGADEDDKETDQEIPLGKHFMVFMCQNFATDGGPSRFMVARYCLGGLTTRWIRSHVLQITAVLSAYGFVVISNGFDGASENRSAMRQLLTKTLIEVKPYFLTE